LQQVFQDFQLNFAHDADNQLPFLRVPGIIHQRVFVGKLGNRLQQRAFLALAAGNPHPKQGLRNAKAAPFQHAAHHVTDFYAAHAAKCRGFVSDGLAAVLAARTGNPSDLRNFRLKGLRFTGAENIHRVAVLQRAPVQADVGDFAHAFVMLDFVNDSGGLALGRKGLRGKVFANGLHKRGNALALRRRAVNQRKRQSRARLTDKGGFDFRRVVHML
jgi:hypothetical protein